MFRRKLAEVIIFAFVGALITPTIASILAKYILDEVSQHYAVPMAAIALVILSFIISTIIKSVLASRMSINMDHISVMLSIFILQFFICSIFVGFGMSLVYAGAVILGSFISLVITIIKRPFTLYDEVKGKVKDKQHPEEKKKKKSKKSKK